MTKCPECSDTGERDSGGMHPWGESILLPCDCKDAEIGRQWRENSSLEEWFPLTAERLVALERDLQYARDGLTKGRTRMREDNERLRAALVKIEAGCCIDPRTVAREALGPNDQLEPGPQDLGSKRQFGLSAEAKGKRWTR